MSPKEGHRCDSRRHSFREVSKASQAEMNSPVGVLRLEVICNQSWDQNHLTLGKINA